MEFHPLTRVVHREVNFQAFLEPQCARVDPYLLGRPGQSGGMTQMVLPSTGGDGEIVVEIEEIAGVFVGRRTKVNGSPLALALGGGGVALGGPCSEAGMNRRTDTAGHREPPWTTPVDRLDEPFLKPNARSFARGDQIFASPQIRPMLVVPDGEKRPRDS